MQQHTSSSILRGVLWADAVIGLGTAAIHLVAATWLASWLGLSALLLFASGLLIVPYAGLAAVLARQAWPVRGLLWLLVLGNLAWAAGALLLALGSTGAQASVWGLAYLAVHAVSVVVLGGLEWFWGLRRSAALAMA